MAASNASRSPLKSLVKSRPPALGVTAAAIGCVGWYCQRCLPVAASMAVIQPDLAFGSERPNSFFEPRKGLPGSRGTESVWWWIRPSQRVTARGGRPRQAIARLQRSSVRWHSNRRLRCADFDRFRGWLASGYLHVCGLTRRQHTGTPVSVLRQSGRICGQSTSVDSDRRQRWRSSNRRRGCRRCKRASIDVHRSLDFESDHLTGSSWQRRCIPRSASDIGQSCHVGSCPHLKFVTDQLRRRIDRD